MQISADNLSTSAAQPARDRVNQTAAHLQLMRDAFETRSMLGPKFTARTKAMYDEAASELYPTDAYLEDHMVLAVYARAIMKAAEVDGHARPVVEMTADNGARVEVRRMISGSYSNMHFPDAARPDHCHPSSSAFISSDEAITAAALWIAVHHSQAEYGTCTCVGAHDGSCALAEVAAQ